MTQSELNRALARATGESTRLIRHMGFFLLTRPGTRKPARRSRPAHAANNATPPNGSICRPA